MDKGTLRRSLPLAEMQDLSSQATDMVGVNTLCLPAPLVWGMAMGYGQRDQGQPPVSSVCSRTVRRRANDSQSPAAKREVKTLGHDRGPQVRKFPLKVAGRSLFQQIPKQNKH